MIEVTDLVRHKNIPRHEVLMALHSYAMNSKVARNFIAERLTAKQAKELNEETVFNVINGLPINIVLPIETNDSDTWYFEASLYNRVYGKNAAMHAMKKLHYNYLPF